MPFRAERRFCCSNGDEPAARPDALVAERAAEQWGVLSLAELCTCGLSRQSISSRERRGWLHRLHRGVYAVGHSNPPRQGWLLAAVKACGPGAVLSHLSAAELWGLTDAAGRYPEVTVPALGSRAHPGIRVHRSALLERCDVTRRMEIPVTTPARAIVDCASRLPYRELRRMVRQAQSSHRVNLRGLAAAVNRLGPRRGVRNLARIIATGPAPTHSELEDVVLDLLLAGGFEHPAVNEPLLIEGRRIVPDFRWAERRIVVEADGAAWHDGSLAREDDAERQALLESHGERVLRVTWDQAVARSRQTLVRIRESGAPQARPAAVFSVPG